MCTPDLSLCPIIPFITFLKFSTESEFCLESESGITINCHVSLVSFNLNYFQSLSLSFDIDICEEYSSPNFLACVLSCRVLSDSL